MDCKSLHENSPERHYWGNASHYLFSNQAHSHIYFNHLAKDLEEKSSDLGIFREAFNIHSKQTLITVSIFYYFDTYFSNRGFKKN